MSELTEGLAWAGVILATGTPVTIGFSILLIKATAFTNSSPDERQSGTVLNHESGEGAAGS